MPAIPVHHTAVQDGAWDGPANEAKLPNDIDKPIGQGMWAWYDGSAPDSDSDGGYPDAKSAYKLPHHFVSDGKPGAASIQGVRAALARLSQSNTQIPDSDKAAVKAHLEAHVNDYEKKSKSQLVEDDDGVFAIEEVHLDVMNRVWAVRPELLSALAERRIGVRVSAATIEAAVKARPKPQTASGGVAVIPLKGIITPGTSLLSLLFGSGGLAAFRSQIQDAAQNGDVKSIVLNVDSPGGIVDHVPETAATIREAGTQKPIVAVANTIAGSAAYWLASQAHEVVVTPSGEVGSIGAYQIHKDVSRALAMDGVKPTIISAGKYKLEGNPFEPLGEEAATAAQQSVNDYYDLFVRDVALGRDATPEDVQAGYGQGRMLTAERARKAGLADRVATLDQTISRLASGRARVRRAEDRMTLEWDETNGRRGLSPDEQGRLLDTLGLR